MNISENIQENSMQSYMVGHRPDILLLGGAGFLGRGLARELSKRGFSFKVVDMLDMDFSDMSNVPKLADIVSRFDYVFLLASQIGAKLF